MTANSSTKKDAETSRQFRLTPNALELQLEKKQLGSHFQDCSSPLPSLNNYSNTFNLYLRTGPLQSYKCLLKHTPHKTPHFLKWKIHNFYNHFFFIFSFWTVLKIKIILLYVLQLHHFYTAIVQVGENPTYIGARKWNKALVLSLQIFSGYSSMETWISQATPHPSPHLQMPNTPLTCHWLLVPSCFWHSCAG